ncbi:glutamate receptor ionotropic, kainate glr-3-like [Neocloeon triangulifer]|uniref:glutamate receptor ionotropic, kainate glr-3-like n=1 Tax=Neocloeon triangulifer TaxID=2078957 RepID=UPI00286EDE82|nr:glutamate receptor ionotropic, kainate glr-3-like [Neocloeon triangulifer]
MVAKVFKSAVEIYEIYSTGQHKQSRILGSWNADSVNRLNLYGFNRPKLIRRRNLMGMKIKVSSVYLNPQYTILGNDANNKSIFVGGYAGKIMNNFKDILNLTFDIKPLHGYSYGLYEPSNDSWSGLMGDLQRGEADAGGCEISSAANRLKYVDFTQPIQIIGRQLHYRKPDRQFNWDTFLRPFSSNIWIALSLTLPLAAAIKFSLYKLSLSFDADKEGKTNFGADFFGAYSALVLQGWSGYFGAPSRRFFIWTVFACYMIISLAYSAKMVAMRTNEKPELPINSLDDILNKGDWDFGFIAKALERDMFQFASPNSLLGKIWKKKIEAKKKQTLVNDIQSGLSRAFNAKYVFMCFQLPARKILHNQFGLEKACEIHVLKEVFFKHGLSIGLKKNSELREMFNHRLMILLESGLLDIELQHSMTKEAVCEIEAFTKINILDVAPALILLGFGMAVALFVLALECAWIWRKNRLSDIENQRVLNILSNFESKKELIFLTNHHNHRTIGRNENPLVYP